MTPDTAPIIETVRALIDDESGAEAERACAQFLRDCPAGTEARLVEGLLLTIKGMPNEAITAYEQALSLAPNSLPAYMGIAEILAKKGWLHSALVVMENARAVAPFTNAAQTLLDKLQGQLAAARPVPGVSP